MIFTLILTSSSILLTQDTSTYEFVPYNQEEYQKIIDLLESKQNLTSWAFPEAMFENGIDDVYIERKPLRFITIVIVFYLRIISFFSRIFATATHAGQSQYFAPLDLICFPCAIIFLAVSAPNI